MNRTAYTFFALLALWITSVRASDLPVSGRPPVAALQGLDAVVCSFMDTNEISAGVVGVMQNGRIIYLRGFGVDYDGKPLPENALFRIASVTKPITAAAIRQLVPDPVNTNAFDLGQIGGGLLDCLGKYEPWASASTGLLGTITVDDLLRHAGGWDLNNIPDTLNYLDTDLTYNEILIADEMGADPD
jgi:CubicO group peptidase (beta-lactamase class C family)